MPGSIKFSDAQHDPSFLGAFREIYSIGRQRRFRGGPVRIAERCRKIFDGRDG